MRGGRRCDERRAAAATAPVGGAKWALLLRERGERRTT